MRRLIFEVSILSDTVETPNTIFLLRAQLDHVLKTQGIKVTRISYRGSEYLQSKEAPVSKTPRDV